MEQARERDKEALLELIQDPDKNPQNTPMREINQLINTLLLRARMNPQRSYEIYSICTESSFTEQSIIDLFKDDPVSMAELIRSRGVKIYSDYNSKFTDFRNEKNY
jgi:hypothetical protein